MTTEGSYHLVRSVLGGLIMIVFLDLTYGAHMGMDVALGHFFGASGHGDMFQTVFRVAPFVMPLFVVASFFMCRKMSEKDLPNSEQAVCGVLGVLLGSFVVLQLQGPVVAEGLLLLGISPLMGMWLRYLYLTYRQEVGR